MSLNITGGACLLPEGFAPADLRIADGTIAPPGPATRRLDANGLLVLPGIVDLHGDAFERQIQPRPGVGFPLPLALADTEAQLLANGITTAFHGVTLSWEPGLRGAEAWTALLDALHAARPRSLCDMRVHLRWEAFNIDALGLALDAIGAGRVQPAGVQRPHARHPAQTGRPGGAGEVQRTRGRAGSGVPRPGRARRRAPGGGRAGPGAGSRRRTRGRAADGQPR